MFEIPEDIFRRTPDGNEIGVLELAIGRVAGKSVATKQFHTRALKVVRTHYLDDSGQAYITIVNPGGGYVGSDAYRISVDVTDGSSLLLTDQSATKVYRTPNNFVTQNIAFTVGDGAVLEYIPDQLILYKDADYRQFLSADVHPNGSLFVSDIVTPGWSPDGSQFRYEQALLRTEVRVAGQLEVLDNIRLRPMDEQFHANQQFFMADRTHISTVICLDPNISDDDIAEIRKLVASHSGGQATVVGDVSATDRPGFVVRALSNRTEELLELTLAIANYVRAKTRNQGSIHLRKY